MTTELQYIYTKKRSEFGRQCLFVDERPVMLENLMPNPEMMQDYIFMNPVNQGTQCSSLLAEHEVILKNPILVKYTHPI